MVIDLMVERIWAEARPIVLSWSDEASEIFVIDLPLTQVAPVLDTLSSRLIAPSLLRLDGINLARARALDPHVMQQIIRTSARSTVHCLRGDVGEVGASCYFYLWTDAERQRLEVEMVFWNDVCFPAGRPLARHKWLLGQLLRVAEAVRGDNHQSKCILSREYNAEPRELLSSARVAIW
ncbi:hypothetical protein [Motiliproteus sediminis]|uniref:hypothetical protein n=1 Tax=Motiliproteus sediminis TaxID=1468178 RepID=UPI001AEFAC12|nr:hypothetical protein [Motiliproteus sediminis]